ncbi:protein FAM83F-like isoform X2 [Tachysurus ichikawai]
MSAKVCAPQVKNVCVRMVRGCGLALSFGKLPGSLSSKYMLVDGEKVMFGSYSFTWTSSRMNRNTITVMSGHVVDFFDSDFRELYAVSEKVDLYQEFHIPKPPRHTMPTPLLKAPPTATQPAPPASTSRFQVSLGESKQVNLKVPAHKYHNPKYALVVGNSLGLTGSLQDLSRLREHTGNSSESNMEKLLHTSGGANKQSDRTPQEETSESKGDVNKSPLFGSKKQRSSFRLFLKGRSPNQSPDLQTANNHNTADMKTANHSQAKPATQIKDSPKLTTQIKQSPKLSNHTKESPKTANHVKEVQPETVQIPNGKHTPPPSSQDKDASAVIDELDDSFVVIEKPNLLKFKSKKSSKLPQRSVSMQVISTGAEEGSKGQKRNQKKSCIQS